LVSPHERVEVWSRGDYFPLSYGITLKAGEHIEARIDPAISEKSSGRRKTTKPNDAPLVESLLRNA